MYKPRRAKIKANAAATRGNEHKEAACGLNDSQKKANRAATQASMDLIDALQRRLLADSSLAYAQRG